MLKKRTPAGGRRHSFSRSQSAVGSKKVSLSTIVMYRLAFVVLAALVALLAPPTSAEVLPFVAGCGRGGQSETEILKSFFVNR